ncbi:hypothetical protein GQ43DRAFT_276108 [Delitschia confertaspora ATCC 74209]|uniref:Uncharacterized protein n=1 Tax=Delitschia confertaspora ATCC 74209 TaxID=1513339 RepID=A0A9P4N0X6_9PLEO|nr:hypothetical protein GQ43DRAFT_276108 [Delitschia confertaspora ATCC 74209]
MYICESFRSCYKLSRMQSHPLANPIMLHSHSLSLTQQPITQHHIWSSHLEYVPISCYVYSASNSRTFSDQVGQSSCVGAYSRG